MLKVLIVDNEQAIRKGIAHCINWKFLQCEVIAQAADGEEAIEIIKQNPPNIVVSDIRMPGMDGLTLSKEIHMHYPEIKIIILTGFPDFEYAKKAIDYQVVDFVLKPTTVEKLQEAIQKAKFLIEKEQAHQKLYENLEDKGKENIMLQRELFFYDLIYSTNYVKETIKEKLITLEINLSHYFVLRFAIHIKNKKEEEIIYQKPIQEAQNIFKECFKEYPIYFVPKGIRYSYAIVCMEKEQEMKKICYEIIDIINTLTTFSVTIGISQCYKNPTLMSDAVKEADNAQRFLEYYREDGAIRFSQLPELTHDTSKEITKLLKQLTSVMENKNIKHAKEIYDTIFIFIKKNKIPYKEVTRIFHLIYNMGIGMLYDYNIEKYISRSSLPSIEELLEKDSVDKTKEHLFEVLSKILNCINENTDSIDGIIRTVKNYIEENISKDLSLKTLSNMVYLSPSYLSKLFKKEIGINLSVYVQNVRIEKAKELLLNTNKKGYEVAEAVGIYDPVYFSRIFKKMTGIKPKDYKNNILNETKKLQKRT